MAEPKVNGLRSIELNVFDLKASTEFYKKAWGLDDVQMTGGTSYLRATGPGHHVVALHEKPRAVARRRVRSAGSAVVHVFVHREGFHDDVVRPLAFQVGDETDAAGVFFV